MPRPWIFGAWKPNSRFVGGWASTKGWLPGRSRMEWPPMIWPWLWWNCVIQFIRILEFLSFGCRCFLVLSLKHASRSTCHWNLPPGNRWLGTCKDLAASEKTPWNRPYSNYQIGYSMLFQKLWMLWPVWYLPKTLYQIFFANCTSCTKMSVFF